MFFTIISSYFLYFHTIIDILFFQGRQGSGHMQHNSNRPEADSASGLLRILCNAAYPSLPQIIVDRPLNNFQTAVQGFVIFQDIADLTVSQGKDLLISLELRLDMPLLNHPAQKLPADNRIALLHILLDNTFHLTGLCDGF